MSLVWIVIMSSKLLLIGTILLLLMIIFRQETFELLLWFTCTQGIDSWTTSSSILSLETYNNFIILEFWIINLFRSLRYLYLKAVLFHFLIGLFLLIMTLILKSRKIRAISLILSLFDSRYLIPKSLIDIFNRQIELI